MAALDMGTPALSHSFFITRSDWRYMNYLYLILLVVNIDKRVNYIILRLCYMYLLSVVQSEFAMWFCNYMYVFIPFYFIISVGCITVTWFTTK